MSNGTTFWCKVREVENIAWTCQDSRRNKIKQLINEQLVNDDQRIWDFDTWSSKD